ncbi:MAG: thrombospondin type 3 repeat-containing protein [Theionarchaea archaeon]|nr:thrombospondin type 3 repeat-containing protein [Theionarchaea archaeon]
MNARKLSVVLVVISLAAMLQPLNCASASLTVNRGCGATYYPGEVVTIGYQVTASSSATVVVTLKVQLPDGSTNTFFVNRNISPNVQYYAQGVAGSQPGTRTVILEWEADAGPGGSDAGAKSCTYTVSSGGTGGGGTTLRIDSNVSGFQVFFDGSYIHTTPYNYAILTLSSGISGSHVVTLKKSGCTDASKTVTIIPGVANQVTINMDCGSGGGGEETSDLDGDGVSDDRDGCYNPDCNIVDSNGCPKDSDRDGLNDCEDNCPSEAGTPADNGCPAGDRDSDGVADDQDGCYNPDCSLVDAQGCPKDTDDDGLNDCEDDCPSAYGERSNDGCPEEDSDGDGVADDQDRCYNPGCSLVDSRGCPWDSDNDGLTDCEDNCPNQAGPRSNYGCPEQTGPSFCLGTGLLAVLVMIGGIVGMRRK